LWWSSSKAIRNRQFHGVPSQGKSSNEETVEIVITATFQGAMIEQHRGSRQPVQRRPACTSTHTESNQPFAPCLAELTAQAHNRSSWLLFFGRQKGGPAPFVTNTPPSVVTARTSSRTLAGTQTLACTVSARCFPMHPLCSACSRRRGRCTTCPQRAGAPACVGELCTQAAEEVRQALK